MKEVGKIYAVPLTSIKVPEGRYREDMGDIESLAESILLNGLITPISITEDNVLIAGERRFRAHELIKAETIKAIIQPVDDLNRRILEIIENIDRKDFIWQEEVNAKQDLHQMMLSKNPEGWSGTRSAEEVGLSRGGFAYDLNLAEALKNMPEIFEGCKTKTQALKALKEFNIDETMAEIYLRESSTNYGRKAKDMVFHGDCLDLVKQIPNNRINAVISDPFYGLDISNTKKHEGDLDIYEDNIDLYKATMSTMISEFPRILKDDGWVVIFGAIENFQFLYDELQGAGINCDHMPGIWHRTGAAGQTNNPNHRFARNYEMFIYGYKGEAQIKRPGLPLVLPYAGVPSMDKIHPVQKPLELMMELIYRLCLPGHTILDFMCGSGTTLKAAIKLGCIPIGFELDESYYNAAMNTTADALRMKDAGKLDMVK